MNLVGSRGAAAQLARLLDRGPSSGSGALARAAALAVRLRLVGTALDTDVIPRAEFRDALRMRLVAVATVQAPAARPFGARSSDAWSAAVSWRASSRASSVLAGALASVVAVSGVAVAGSQSLPGDPFYGVKRTVEALQLRSADGDIEKGTRHLDLAATRLREVRGLALGRDAVHAGPQLGPSAVSAGILLRSSVQPLAADDALNAPVADRVRDTLAAMDVETRDGTTLLTGAYRSSRAPEPLRALTRFAVRQSEGLSQLIPALPPVTQERARVSLALLSGVTEGANELLGIGSCGTVCAPPQVVPNLPPGSMKPADPPCGCEQPAPVPQTSASPPSEAPEPAPQPRPRPTRSASPEPSPKPSPAPSSRPLLPPLPPLPAPVPSLPLPTPLPTLTAPPLPVVPPTVESVLPGLSVLPGMTAGRAPSTPEPEPLPQPQPGTSRP
ncbi:MAG: DUF5667 domain-containing protein [Mycobacteriales bacterium]